MRFEHPLVLQLLWFVPLMWGLYQWSRAVGDKKLKTLLGAKTWAFLTASVSARKRRWKLILRSLFWIFAVLALAKPQSGGSKQEVKSQGFELMILTDVSDSMMAEDVRPNRLEQMKIDMSRLLSLMPGNKVGIVAFAGSAALLSPLSTDPSAIRMYLDSLSTQSVSAQGTNIEAALEEARSAFERGGVGNTDTTRATRVILVVSDGEDHEPGALAKAKALAQDGIRIFALAYGTAKGAPIPVRDSLGFQRGFKKDRKGNTVLTQVNGDALNVLSQSGAGAFYHASPGGDYLAQLVEDFNKLEKSEFDSALMVQYDEKFQYFLAVALIMGLLDLLIGERRGQFKLWRGRYEVPPA